MLLPSPSPSSLWLHAPQVCQMLLKLESFLHDSFSFKQSSRYGTTTYTDHSCLAWYFIIFYYSIFVISFNAAQNLFLLKPKRHGGGGEQDAWASFTVFLLSVVLYCISGSSSCQDVCNDKFTIKLYCIILKVFYERKPILFKEYFNRCSLTSTVL